MDSIQIFPSSIKGDISIPPSKSLAQRSVVAALLRKGKTTLTHYGSSDDEEIALKIAASLGATVSKMDENIIIDSPGIQDISSKIHCGESGLSFRMFAIIAALSTAKNHFEAAPALMQRPMDELVHIYQQWNKNFIAENNSIPFSIDGKISWRDLHINGNISSQYVSGLLFAHSYAVQEQWIDKPIHIHVVNLTSKPYVDLTLDLMEQFQLPLPIHDNYEVFTFHPSANAPASSACSYEIEGDWSSAAAILVAGAVLGEVRVKGLNMFTKQADKAILLALQQASINMSISVDNISIRPSQIEPFTYFDATECPDLFPPLAALAACTDSICAIRGVHRLIHKESNRALAIQTEFAKVGIEVKFQDDDMIIYGTSNFPGAAFHSHHDHRIAMTCTILALKANSPSTLEDARAIAKSYPDFFEHLKSLGANIK